MVREGRRAARASEVAALILSAPFDEVEALASRYAEDPRKQVQRARTVALKRHAREVAERERVSGMYALQAELAGGGVALGVDEVGRGAVAGPLTVAAVALPLTPCIWGLNDSKQLTPARRETLASVIVEQAIALGMAHVEPAVIDAVGMASALRGAMAQAIADAGIEPDAVLIDGNPVHVHPRERCLVKGDARVACIAAASVVAKVARDELMVALDADYPGYHLAACKGYASEAHVAAIRAKGLTPLHRATFCGNFLETPRLF